MTCSCPKCDVNIPVDLNSVSNEGSFSSCPECKGRFWMNQESFARRALKKEGKIYCVKCGNNLGLSIGCGACGVVYPDYILVQTTKPAHRQTAKASVSFDFSLGPKRKSYTYSDERRSSSKTTSILSTRLKLVLVAVLIAVIATASYLHISSQLTYSANYIRALYVIKTGTELGLNSCAKVSADWKTTSTAAQNTRPRISQENETNLNIVKDEIDKYMLTLKDPPGKYIKANEEITKLHGLFMKVYSLALSSDSSLSAFSESINKSEIEYKLTIKELKANLPENLVKDIEKAKSKYRGLRDF